ncbi:MAG: TerB family tellurite resistance protein [Sedimentisphaerales bacterium]|nr:TerB family tellurite resistance protein [Sedimentisphaerales bacterium]
MNQTEQIQYLANIYYLARADENFEVEEDYMIQEIAKEIGAGYLETRKALDMSMADDFKVIPPARLSDRLRTVEDMLFVAYCDKKFHPMEKKIVLNIAKQVGVKREQFEEIRSETKERLEKRNK